MRLYKVYLDHKYLMLLLLTSASLFSQNATIEIVKTVPLSGYANVIAAQDDYVYAAYHQLGAFIVIDVSIPEESKIVGTCALKKTPLFLKVKDSLAFISTSPDSELTVINVSDPQSPHFFSYFNIPDRSHYTDI